MARKQWRCFFCNEIFTRYSDAAEHFGADESFDITACRIAPHEGHLITYIRKLESELRTYHLEDTDILRSIRILESETTNKVRRAEETGYAKAVADMKTQGFCPEPKAHSI